MIERLSDVRSEGSFWWEISHRPLVPATIALTSGVASAFHWVWLVVGVLAFIFSRKRSDVIVIASALILGWLLRPDSSPRLVHENEEFSGTVVLKSMPQPIHRGFMARATANSDSYLILLPPDSQFVPGDQLAVYGTLRPLREGSGYQGGARGVILPEEASKRINGWSGFRLGYKIRDSFKQSVESSVRPQISSYVMAMCFNQTEGLEDSDWESFRKSGLTHVVSASGFHVIVTAGLLLVILSLVPIPRWTQLMLVALMLLLYAFASGFRPPICRAVLMCYVALFAYFWRRQGDGLSALALASSFNILVNPSVIADLGFHLSVAAVSGLILFAPKPDENYSWRSAIKLSTLGSLVAIISTLPITLYVFGEFSMWSLAMNVLVLPFIAATVSFSLVAWIIGLVFPPAGLIIWAGIVTPATEIAIQCSQFGASLPGSSIAVPAMPLWLVWVAYLLLLMIWRPQPREV
ncbi:ComEC/Rec2 family competence protein [Kamptonema cortianum]|nr:ComEC/Rec2 family competence protein [Geitlerinema splendidum]MDK3160939.1 ComEC/Rec2 family competence protein [Kamptonema cortianum]